MKLAPLASIAIIVGLVGYIIGGVAPSTPAQSGWSGVPTVDQIMGRGPAPFAVSHPRDWVQILEATPYTVPAGRILVITALGSVSAGPSDPVLYASFDNGATWQQRVAASPQNAVGGGTSMKPVPICLGFPEGVRVQVLNGGGYGSYWGYLVDA